MMPEERLRIAPIRRAYCWCRACRLFGNRGGVSTPYAKILDGAALGFAAMDFCRVLDFKGRQRDVGLFNTRAVL